MVSAADAFEIAEVVLIASARFPAARWQQAFGHGRVLERDLGQAEVTASLSALLAARPRVIWLAAEPGWVEALEVLQRAQPQCPIVLVSLEPTVTEGLQALGLGIRGYAHALGTPALLQDVAQAVQHGGLWLGPELMARLLTRAVQITPVRRSESSDAALATASDLGLSQRESEVAQAVMQGMSNKEIARVLGITERTVKAHMAALFAKLGVRDRIQLVIKLRGR